MHRLFNGGSRPFYAIDINSKERILLRAILNGHNGFTNDRDRPYKVALSPAMRRYLSHLRNDGSNANRNENFAREVLQLFSLGLFMLGRTTKS